MRLDKTRTKEEKEIYNIMKVFARFNTPEDHDKLVQGIIKEKQIRQRIAELKELKGKGFRTLGDVEDELDGKKRKDDKSKKRDV
jgi:transcriptional adapter 2-alpha